MAGPSVPYLRENWKVEIEEGDVYIMGDDNRSVAYVGRVNDIRVRRAQVMAAAPDMLRALQSLQQSDGHFRPCFPYYGSCLSDCAVLRNALNKALEVVL